VTPPVTVAEQPRHALPGDRRQRWAELGTELAVALLSGSEPEDALRTMAGQVRLLTRADVAVVLSPSPDDPADLTITIAEGPAVDDVEGVRIPLPGTRLADTYAGGGIRVFDDVTVLPLVGRRAAVVVELTEGYGPAMFVPLGQLPGRRLLAVLRVAGSPPFDADEPELMAACAGRCATLLDLARAQELSRRRQLQGDRERIARDLHDHVVQRIFAIGLSLDRIGRSLEPGHPDAAARLSRIVDDLDATITDIRTAIFELHRTDVVEFPTPSEQLADVVRQATEGQSVHCSVRVQGPVDELAHELLLDVVAVVRELVTNVVRHARATRTTVLVRAGKKTLHVAVTDDGTGLPAVTVRSGLANLADRAERLGGQLSTATAASGTEVRWTVPLPRG
jgi:signal transduction histidine kinase